MLTTAMTTNEDKLFTFKVAMITHKLGITNENSNEGHNKHYKDNEKN